ncbi:MAG TPA: prepilin peptidase [Pirellulales bacterium]|nr:prepilin peptidase [Pirellulales bacterium]
MTFPRHFDRMALAPLLILLWCFAVGACVGSFLNVVAWRLPLGMSLLWPGSHCPKCKKPIRIYDNVPVLGWLMLGGRCRACRAPISPRYPAVEFATGCAFAALAYVELVRAGLNLPGVAPESSKGLLALWLYHALLASLLIVTVLFAWDGARVPPRFIVLGLAAGLFLPLYAPGLYPTDELGDFAEPGLGFAGVLVGAALGVLIVWSSTGRARDAEIPFEPSVVAATFVGAFLGPRPALDIAAVTLALSFVGRLAKMPSGRKTAPATAVLAVVAIAYIAVWRWVVELRWPARYESREMIGLTGAAAVLLGVLSFLLMRIQKRRGA